MENDFIQKILKKVNLDEDLFNQMIMPKVQEIVIEMIKPDENQIRLWKNTATGRKEFEKYILPKFEEIPSGQTVKILWNYYSGYRVGQRNKSIKVEFLVTSLKNKRCAHCGIETGEFHVDHVLPLAKGGEDEVSNLQFLCKQCNLNKSSQFDCKISIF